MPANPVVGDAESIIMLTREAKSPAGQATLGGPFGMQPSDAGQKARASQPARARITDKGDTCVRASSTGKRGGSNGSAGTQGVTPASARRRARWWFRAKAAAPPRAAPRV